MQGTVRGAIALIASIGLIASGTACSSSGDARTGASDDVVLLVVPDLTEEVPDVAFAAVPDLLVTADGEVVYGAPPESASQGALVPDVWAQTLTPAGMEIVRGAIADGVGPADIGELVALVGAELGPTRFYLPDRYRFRAVAAGPAADFDTADIAVITWPDTVSVSLADAQDCTVLPEIEVGELFETAPEEGAFVDDGILYGVVAAQDWPGAPC